MSESFDELHSQLEQDLLQHPDKIFGAIRHEMNTLKRFAQQSQRVVDSNDLANLVSHAIDWLDTFQEETRARLEILEQLVGSEGLSQACPRSVQRPEAELTMNGEASSLIEAVQELARRLSSSE